MLLHLRTPTGDVRLDTEPSIGGGATITVDGHTERCGPVRIVCDITPKQVAEAIRALREAAPKADPDAGPTVAAPDPWAHRSERMRCRTCMWYAAKGDADSQLGRCRRRAPSMNGYPVVFASDWCGDHKLNENAPGAVPVTDRG